MYLSLTPPPKKNQKLKSQITTINLTKTLVEMACITGCYVISLFLKQSFVVVVLKKKVN